MNESSGELTQQRRDSATDAGPKDTKSRQRGILGMMGWAAGGREDVGGLVGG